MYHVSSELAYAIAVAYILIGVAIIAYLYTTDKVSYMGTISKCAVFISFVLFIVSGVWFVIPVVPPYAADGWVDLNNAVGTAWFISSILACIVLFVGAALCLTLDFSAHDFTPEVMTAVCVAGLAIFGSGFGGYPYTDGNVTVTSAEGAVLFENEGLYKNNECRQTLSYVDKDGNIQEYSYAITVSSSRNPVACE